MRIVLSFLAAWLLAFAAPAFAQPVCSVGDQAQVFWKGQWYGARVTRVNETQTRCFIRYDGYGSEWDEWVSSERIRVAGAAPRYKVGDDVQVAWKGKWWPASVISVGEGRWKIHYDGYESSWDEWVGPERMRGR
ncbi:MAG: RNA-binding protein [Burkholderiales bacterium]|nr:RNA-binding protein [Burkholderiales bacterium]